VLTFIFGTEANSEDIGMGRGAAPGVL